MFDVSAVIVWIYLDDFCSRHHWPTSRYVMFLPQGSTQYRRIDQQKLSVVQHMRVVQHVWFHVEFQRGECRQDKLQTWG